MNQNISPIYHSIMHSLMFPKLIIRTEISNQLIHQNPEHVKWASSISVVLICNAFDIKPFQMESIIRHIYPLGARLTQINPYQICHVVSGNYIARIGKHFQFFCVEIYNAFKPKQRNQNAIY